MNSKQFFDYKRNVWDNLVKKAVYPKNLECETVNGSLVVWGEEKLPSAKPSDASAFIDENHIFAVDCSTEEDGYVMDDIVGDFAERTPIEFNLRLYDSNGWSNLYKAPVVAVETEDGSEDAALNPESAIFVTGDWELVSSNRPKEKDKEEKPKCNHCSSVNNEFDEVLVRQKGNRENLTDLQLFDEYIREVRAKALKNSFDENGCGRWSSTFSQQTDKDGKTTISHSVNDGDVEVNVFDKDGNLISANGKEIKCGGSCKCGCGKDKH